MVGLLEEEWERPLSGRRAKDVFSQLLPKQQKEDREVI